MCNQCKIEAAMIDDEDNTVRITEHTPGSALRKQHLKRYSARFAAAVVKRAEESGSTLTEADLNFLFMEIFGRLDEMKPMEMIMAFKLVSSWAGFEKVPEKALAAPTMLKAPVLTFRKVSS